MITFAVFHYIHKSRRRKELLTDNSKFKMNGDSFPSQPPGGNVPHSKASNIVSTENGAGNVEEVILDEAAMMSMSPTTSN